MIPRLLGALICLMVLSHPVTAEDVNVFAGIEPSAFIVRSVGVPHVKVGVLVGPGQNPHTYEPSPRMLAEVSQASLYFNTGLAFEEQLLAKLKSMNPALQVVDLRQGIQMRQMQEGHAEHGEVAGAPDPHIWLNPLNAKIMAGAVARALTSADPGHAADYENNLHALERELDGLNARIASELAPYRGRAFYAYHPAFGYFGDAYGLVQAPVEISGKEPTARQLGELIDRAKAQGIRVILVQKQFSDKSAQAVAREIGGEVVAVDPLSGDYVRNLEEIAEKLREGFEKK